MDSENVRIPMEFYSAIEKNEICRNIGETGQLCTERGDPNSERKTLFFVAALNFYICMFKLSECV